MHSITTSWTAAHQAPLFMEFSRQEYWSELPFFSRGSISCTGRWSLYCSATWETQNLVFHLHFLPVCRKALSIINSWGLETPQSLLQCWRHSLNTQFPFQWNLQSTLEPKPEVTTFLWLSLSPLLFSSSFSFWRNRHRLEKFTWFAYYLLGSGQEDCLILYGQYRCFWQMFSCEMGSSLSPLSATSWWSPEEHRALHCFHCS